MFEKDYKAQMDAVAPDKELRENILERLNSAAVPKATAIEKKEKMLRSRSLWRAGFAVAAAFAVAASAVFISKSNKAVASPQLIAKAESYNEIYKKINSLTVKQNSFLNFARKGNDLETIEEYEAADGSAKPGTAASTNTTSSTASKSEDDYSKTNTQVDGVDEADTIKTDGKYIYTLKDNAIKIIRANAGATELISEIKLSSSGYCNNFYLSGNRITAIIQSAADTEAGTTVQGRVKRDCNNTAACFYDISEPAEPKLSGTAMQSGELSDSRIIGDRLYLVTSYTPYGDIEKSKPESFVPSVSCNGKGNTVPAESVCIYTAEKYTPVYTTACIYSTENGEMLDTQSLLGGSGSVYCNTNTLITAISDYTDAASKTVVSYFSIDKNSIKLKGNATINGTLLNQFSMDEQNGYFRFVTTTDTSSEEVFENGDIAYTKILNSTDVSLIILDSSLQPVSSLNNLAAGERVYSVRFMGDIVYFVTFRETDPLFSVDISEPKNPKVLGALKIPGFSSYLFPYGSGKLLGLGMDADEATGRTECLKLSMFDISDPDNVTENDKYLIKNSHYSPALYNHKASLVDADKNLIGFEAVFEDAGSNTLEKYSYELFRYENGTFLSIASIKLRSTECSIYSNLGSRGLFIGDIFYLVTPQRIASYSLRDGFALISELTL